MHLHISTLLFLLVLYTISDSFLLDDASPTQATSTTSFKLTVTPSHVTKSITNDVTLECSHDEETLPQFGEISRIRIMRLTATGWTLFAQKTLANETSISDKNVNVTGNLSNTVNDTSLEITWLLASEDTFGTYRCDVIGLDASLNAASESTAELTIVEQAVTTDDLFKLLLQTREELSILQHDVINRLDTLETKLSDLDDDALTISDAAAWPQGQYALLQPGNGCPVDLTFLGGSSSYFVLHTESSSGRSNGNSYTKAMPVSTTTKLNGDQNLYTLRFCEAKRAFSTRRWPLGHYCINKIHKMPCPTGFTEGAITLDAEDNNTISDLQGNVINEFGDRAKFGFCCKDGGSATYGMHLPTSSPFMLYRKGGKCQAVRGMKVSDEHMTLDTEDTNNGDSVSGMVPDIFLLSTSSKPVRFPLCYYTPI